MLEQNLYVALYGVNMQQQGMSTIYSLSKLWEYKKDAQGVVVMASDGIPKQVNKNVAFFDMEITLYMDMVKMILKKQHKWLNIRVKNFHLVLQHSPPKLSEL